MTIQSILKRAASLLGAAEGDPDAGTRKERLSGALDSALGEISRAFPIQARCKITLENGEAALPEAVLSPRGLYKEGRRVPLCLSEGKLLGPDGSYTLVYYRVPSTVSLMEETTTLPYPEDVQRALPFYCAALYVMGEDNALYNQLMEQYNIKLSTALGYRPSANVEGGGCL